MSLKAVPAATVALSALVALVLVVVLVFLDGSGGSNGFVIGGIVYNHEPATVSLPSCPSTNGSTGVFQFQNVSFRLHVTNWCSPGGGALSGAGTESNGTSYNILLPGMPGPSQWVTWISPDKVFGVEWDRVNNVNLLAEAPL
jgi:hypothetical protein